MSDKLYTAEHLWLQLQKDGSLLVGITPYAGVTGSVEALQTANSADIILSHSTLCSIETNKCIYEIQLPFPCKLLAVNQELIARKQSVLDTDNWICKVHPVDENWMSELMDFDTYKNYAEV